MTPGQKRLRKVSRAAVSAAWSAPARVLTVPAIVGGMMLTAGGSLSPDDLLNWRVVGVGILTSLLLRFIDQLLVEFILFPKILRVFIKGE